jgi:hypothetical protein
LANCGPQSSYLRLPSSCDYRCLLPSLAFGCHLHSVLGEGGGMESNTGDNMALGEGQSGPTSILQTPTCLAGLFWVHYKTTFRLSFPL